MVIMALTIGVTLAVTFLAAQSTSLGVAHNVEHTPPARYAAETGLRAAVRYLKDTNPRWRQEHASGEWTRRTSFAGGTFRVKFVDPEDDDLRDDYSDRVRIVAAGELDGVTGRQRVTVRPPEGIQSGLAVSGEVALGNKALIDSFDSSDGRYSTARAEANARLTTNSTREQAIQIDDSGVRVKGDVAVGPGGDPDRVIESASSANISGTTASLDVAQAVPEVLPPDLGPVESGRTYDFGIHTINEDLHVNELKLEGFATLRVTGKVRVHVEDSVEVGDHAKLQVAADSQLTLYVDNGVEVGDHGRVNVNSGDPGQLILHEGGGGIQLGDRAEMYGSLLSPQKGLQLGDRAELAGSYRGKELSVGDQAQIHQDTAEPEQGGGDAFQVDW